MGQSLRWTLADTQQLLQRLYLTLEVLTRMPGRWFVCLVCGADSASVSSGSSKQHHT